MRIKLDVFSLMSFLCIQSYNCSSLDKINIIIKYHEILSNDITLSNNETKREDKLNFSSISGGSRISRRRWGRQPLRLGWKHIIWQDFCWKLNEKWKKLDRGGARDASPLDPPISIPCWNYFKIVSQWHFFAQCERVHGLVHFFQSTYYMEGDTGHKVFQTQFGKLVCFWTFRILHSIHIRITHYCNRKNPRQWGNYCKIISGKIATRKM